MAKNFNEVAQELVKQGKQVVNVTVMETNFVGDRYIEVKIDKQVKACKQQEDKTFAIVDTDTIHLSKFVLQQMFMEHRRLNVVNLYKVTYTDIKQLLKGMQLRCVVVEVTAGDEYQNPFSDNEPKVMDKDVVLYYPIEMLEIAKEGKEIAQEQAIRLKLGEDAFVKYIAQKVMDDRW